MRLAWGHNDEDNMGPPYPAFHGRGQMDICSASDPLALTSGALLEEVTVNYQTYGNLNNAGDNAILVCHALTAGSLVGTLEEEDKEKGWWEPLVGPGKALDTNKYFVICINAL